jgi:hypothetical protein
VYPGPAGMTKDAMAIDSAKQQKELMFLLAGEKI